MTVDKIEALVDAIGRLNGIHNPDSDAYQLRSPLLLKSFARPGKNITDDLGRRVFTSLLAGYRAAIFDVQLKAEGKSRAGLKPEDGIVNLLGCYGIQEKAAVDNIVAFLRRSLKDQAIKSTTPLSYFLTK